MDDKHSRQHFPEEDSSSPSSTPKTARIQSRYKPLAPKGPLSDAGHASQRLQRSRSGAGEAAQQLQDLTFVNTTDPQQSRSSESRQFVRRQVMVNFAREKRRQQKPPSPGSVNTGTTSTNTVSGVRELLNAAMPPSTARVMTPGGLDKGAAGLDNPSRHDVPDPLVQVAEAPAHLARHVFQRRDSALPPNAARLVASTVGKPADLALLATAHWPVTSDTPVQDLVNHCYSRLFRACHPHYMISLLAGRPDAEQYPFFVDIDSVADLQQDYGAQSAAPREFYRLAEGSSMLAHALLMVSASQLAILEPVDAIQRTRQAIDHKSKALQLLNEAIKDVPADNYVESLAKIAVLASHELMTSHYNEWMVHLMGFGRIVNMKGGLTSLPPHNLVRKLIIWTDQMGALFMHMRPFFPATEVMSLFFRPRTTIPPSLLEEYVQQDFLSPLFRDFATAFRIPAQLTDVLEDVNTIRTVGTENIVNAGTAASISALVEMRDVLLHRILSLAPIGSECDDELSAEECIRLATLIFALDKLFLPVLPPAYHRIMHIAIDRLYTALEGKVLSQEWACHGWVLMWIAFVGATVHSGDVATRKGLVQHVAPLCGRLFSRQRDMSSQLRTGFTVLIGTLKLFEESLIDGFAVDLEQAWRA